LSLAGGYSIFPVTAASAGFGISDVSAEEALLGTVPENSDSPGDLFEFNQKDWNDARDSIDEAEHPKPIAPTLPLPAKSGEAPSGITVDLPYESGLSISGRKLIAVKLSQTRRKSAKRSDDLGVPQSQNDMEMHQELQVRIVGKVGRKITVNVDFDDTKEDKKDISVMYQGDPGEFVQEAAFGDITLSLPSTEFVSFSKQLFGVRTKLQYKNASLLAIGSRTKGTTETKRFNGATKFERRIIPGSAYFKKQYYSVAFTTRPIVAGSELVWRDDGDFTNNNQTPITENKQVQDYDDFTLYTSTGMFDKLKPGDDYTLDPGRGLLFFKRQVAASAVIAIDYQFADDGSWLSQSKGGNALALVKTANDEVFVPGGTAHLREVKTFYPFGNIKLVQDNGAGNFILHTIDGNQLEKRITLTSNEFMQYRSSDTAQDRSTLQVDFDLGVFNIFFSTGRFNPDDYLRVLDSSSTLYAVSPTSDFSFLTEYRYRLRDFQLRPNIVFNSERVTVNGRLMKSEIDYFLDTASGLLQFFNDNELDENSQIEVTYDYAPFGGQLGQTLVGARAELGLIPGKFQLGSTFLYTFAPKTTVVPDVRSTPSSLMVLEVDGRMNDVAVPFSDLTVSLSGEAAQSRENPNLYGKALVDSMEGVSQEDSLVLDSDFWPLGANPSGYSVPTDPRSLQISELDMNLQDVVSPGAGVKENEKLRVMEVSIVNVDSKPGDALQAEQSSLIQSLPRGGTHDYSKKAYLEMWLEGFGESGNGVDMWISAGKLNEDSDLDSVADTEDGFPVDGTLNQGEDVGYSFEFWGDDGIEGTGDDLVVRSGADNGRIDAENANGGEFVTNDDPSSGAPLVRLRDLTPANSVVTDRNGIPAPISDLNFTGWRFIRVPLTAIASNPQAYTNVEHVRVTFVSGPRALPPTAKVRIGKLAFVGNTWEKATVTPGATLVVGAVNNLDNPEYNSLIGNPSYNELYGDQADNRSREQALQLTYDLPVGSTVTTRSLFGTPRDFSHHKSLNFFLRRPLGEPSGGTLVVEFGSETDYFQYTRPIGEDTTSAWVLETLQIIDRNNDGSADFISSEVAGSSVTMVGSPSLTRIGQFKIGIQNTGVAPLSSVLWVNEIHVAGSRTRVGNARRFAADGKWGTWGTFGGTFRNVDRDFQTLTSPVVNQDRQEYSGYGNLSKFRFMPLSGKFSRSKTITPAVLQTGQSQLVSVLSEGSEENTDVRGDAQLILPNWPAFSGSAERMVTDSTTNQEIRDRNVYTGSLDYVLPKRLDIMPGKFTFRPLPDSVFLRYTRTNFFLSYYPERMEEKINVSTDPASQRNAIFTNSPVSEFANDWVFRAGFTPWDGLLLTPNFTERRVVEERTFTAEEIAKYPDFTEATTYQKSYSQTRGLSGSWKIFSWLEPRVTYSMSGTETNGLPTVSSPTASNAKLLDRTSAGDVFLNLAPRDLFPKLRLFRTLNMDASFRVDSADTYTGVSKDFTDWKKMGLPEISKITRRDGSTMFSLLSALDFQNTATQRSQLTARNTLRYAVNWSPMDWMTVPYRLEPFKTVNLNNTLTMTNEHTENTLTARDVTTQSWPDIIMTIRDTEKCLFVERWVGASQANIRFSRRKSETIFEDKSDAVTKGLDYRFTFFRRFDVFMAVSATNGETEDLRTGLLKSTQEGYNNSLQFGMKLGNWRVTPSGAMRSDVSQDGTQRYTQDLQTQSISVLGRFDKSYPGGFRFPFTKRVFSNVNRLTLDAKLNWDRRISSLNYDRDNTDTYSADATGEWEISKNFRLSFGGKLGMVVNRVRSEDGLMTVEMNSQLVIQF
jgi:hypothetical protein